MVYTVTYIHLEFYFKIKINMLKEKSEGTEDKKGNKIYPRDWVVIETPEEIEKPEKYEGEIQSIKDDKNNEDLIWVKREIQLNDKRIEKIIQTYSSNVRLHPTGRN